MNIIFLKLLKKSTKENIYIELSYRLNMPEKEIPKTTLREAEEEIHALLEKCLIEEYLKSKGLLKEYLADLCERFEAGDEAVVRPAPIPAEDHPDAFITERAVEAIQALPTDRPMFLCVSLGIFTLILSLLHSLRSTIARDLGTIAWSHSLAALLRRFGPEGAPPPSGPAFARDARRSRVRHRFPALAPRRGPAPRGPRRRRQA